MRDYSYLKTQLQQFFNFFKFWLLQIGRLLYSKLLQLLSILWHKIKQAFKLIKVYGLKLKPKIAVLFNENSKPFYLSFIGIFVGSAFIITLFFWLVTEPSIGQAGKATHFNVPPGASLKQISKIVAKHGVDPSFFLFLVKALGYSENLKKGDYKLQGLLSYLDFIQLLKTGQITFIKLTFQEGLNAKEVFARLKKSKIANTGEYQKYAENPGFLNQLIFKEHNSLEGFLFPETYFIDKEASEKQILKEMVLTFFEKIDPDYEQKSKAVGLTFYEAVILASMIEKETGFDGDRKTISSVFHNRIKKGMRLDSDPTVIYGIKDFDGNITHKHLRTPTKYNTYTFIGLPPTPIANPGTASLNAAINPANTDYLFFVAKGDGRSYFSKTYKEHLNAVNKYQLNQR